MRKDLSVDQLLAGLLPRGGLGTDGLDASDELWIDSDI